MFQGSMNTHWWKATTEEGYGLPCPVCGHLWVIDLWSDPARLLEYQLDVPPVQLAFPNHFVVCFSEGFLFVLGGQDEDKVTLNSGEKYDPDTNSWSSLPPMNEASLPFC